MCIFTRCVYCIVYVATLFCKQASGWFFICVFFITRSVYYRCVFIRSAFLLDVYSILFIVSFFKVPIKTSKNTIHYFHANETFVLYGCNW